MLVRSPLILAALAFGCAPTMTGLPDDPDANPLIPGVPMYPFPSDFYLEDDPGTATGRSLRLPQAMLPVDISAQTWDHVDGFSRIPAIIVHLPGGFDPASLPDPGDPGATLSDDSSVWLLREDTWERVPALVEVDLQTNNVERQALILRPHVALDPSTGYVVVLRDTVDRADGSSHAPSDAFVALRDGIRTDSDTVEGMRDDFALVLEGLDASEVDPEEVLLAWSFHTRSREQLETPLGALHDAMMEAPLDDWTLDSDAVVEDRREIRGTVTLPEFVGDGALVLDDDGLPIQQGTSSIRFLVSIPDTVVAPRPVVAFGHGFFSQKEEITWSSLDDGLHQWQMSAISIDFVGFDEPSWPDAVSAVTGDLVGLDHVLAQQLQNQARFTALARLVDEELAEAITAEGDSGTYHPLVGQDVRYMGISNGGTQGFPILAFSPVLRRGVLVVPGGGWSHMLQRATQWNTLGFILENRYEDPLELQLVLSLLQLSFDPVDALSYADRLLLDPMDGLDPLELSLHEAVGDTQVSNLVTHWVARSAGVPLVTPSPLDVWGLETVTAAPPGRADLSAALVIYDEGYDPLPEGNVPPPEENGAHDSVRRLQVYKDNVGAFLEDGTVLQVCEGACDPD